MGRLRRAVLRKGDRAGAPIAEAATGRNERVDDVVSVFAGLDNAIQNKARLGAAVTVRDEFVAVLREFVQRPLVNIQDAQAVPVVHHHVIDAPGRVIGPRELERAVPQPGIFPSLRVVVRRHLHLDSLDLERDLRDGVAELLGVNGESHDSGVRVNELCVDDLGVSGKSELVADFRGVVVLGDAPGGGCPTGRSLQARCERHVHKPTWFSRKWCPPPFRPNRRQRLEHLWRATQCLASSRCCPPASSNLASTAS